MLDSIKISDGIYRIPTLFSHAINSFALIDDDDKVVLIDAGLKGSTKKLISALDSIGKQPTDVKMILLTHAHSDHLGGVNNFNAHSHSPVLIHDSDKKYAQDGKAPEVESALAKVFTLFNKNIDKVSIADTFKDDDILKVRDGIQVIHTPGHTPGHVSFYDKKTGTLITGDALFNMRDKITHSVKLFCYDSKMAKESTIRLGDLDVEAIGFMHGREITQNAKNTLKDFLIKKSQ
jgi:glyoxylase-like metal-dependent hydrolase (beta-lactamase superfamily II)